MGGVWPKFLQLGRELADFCGLVSRRDDRLIWACNSNLVAAPISKRFGLFYQYRYPSPCRSGPIRIRPTLRLLSTIGRATAATSFLRQANSNKQLVFASQTQDSAKNNAKLKKGSILCKNSVFFSWQQLSSRFQRAWTVIWNAVSRAQQLVLSSRRSLASIQLLGLSLAVPQVHFATKSSAYVTKASSLVPLVSKFILEMLEPFNRVNVSLMHSRTLAPATGPKDMSLQNTLGTTCSQATSTCENRAWALSIFSKRRNGTIPCGVLAV